MNSIWQGKTLGELYDYCCLHYRDKTAIVFGETQYTFGDLKEKSLRLANSLIKLGLKKGDRLAILMPNRPEVLFFNYACYKLGVVRIPLAHYLSAGDISYILRESDACGIVYHDSFRKHIDNLRDGGLRLKHAICSASEGRGAPENEPCLQALIAGGSLDDVPWRVQEDDLARISFTGGTTGTPKGVLHSYRTRVATAIMVLLDFGITHGEIYLASTPLTHASGTFVLPVFLRGGKCVILDGFKPKAFLEMVEKEKVTACFVVPTMIYALLQYEHIQAHNLTSLRNVFYGAAPISPERLKEAIGRFGPILTQLYGSSEAPLALAVFPKEDHMRGREIDPQRISSCGRPTMLTRLKLLGDDGKEVPVGKSGEIVMQSPNLMVGYLKNPELTATTVRDGWLYTGDVGRVDEEGYLYIVDRKKNMIVSGGFNIYPKEIEEVLYRHPAVGEAVVVGVPDARWGEAVKAVVLTKPGHTVTEEELIAFCKEKKGSVQVPKSVDFVTSIPLTPLGKPDPKAIREKYWREYARRVG